MGNIGVWKLAFATCNESSRAWKLPRSPFRECEMTSSQYRRKLVIRMRNCRESEGWAGTPVQLVIAADERSEDAGGPWPGPLLWNTLILLLAIFFFLQAPFPSCLGKAALHVDWGRGNPVCSCHRPVMNHYPVIWPPSPLTRGGGG